MAQLRVVPMLSGRRGQMKIQFACTASKRWPGAAGKLHDSPAKQSFAITDCALACRTLCGKIDRDALTVDQTLPAGFGRSNIDGSALERLGAVATAASLDCSALLGAKGATSGHMLLVGTSDLSLGLEASDAKIAGPVSDSQIFHATTALSGLTNCSGESTNH